MPLDWAMTQMNLGDALAWLAERESGTAHLEEAVAAYRAALEDGASRPCGPVWRANHGSAPVLRPRSLGGFPSSVQRQQILLVARD